MQGHVKPVINRRPLHEANQAYDDLRANRILSRAVSVYACRLVNADTNKYQLLFT